MFAGSDGSARVVDVRPVNPQAMAVRRGHTQRSYFSSAAVELDVAHPEAADLDGEFEATCMETGERLLVCGWLYERDAGAALDTVEVLDGRPPLHPVLHAALISGNCHPTVAALIRDFGERDPVDAMKDARWVAQALRSEDPADRPDVSHVARRAYRDFLRDFSGSDGIRYAEKLAKVLTDWSDTMLAETIAANG